MPSKPGLTATILLPECDPRTFVQEEGHLDHRQLHVDGGSTIAWCSSRVVFCKDESRAYRMRAILRHTILVTANLRISDYDGVSHEQHMAD